jgi:hypothetical protein
MVSIVAQRWVEAGYTLVETLDYSPRNGVWAERAITG